LLPSRLPYFHTAFPACAITTDILQLVGLKSFRVAGVMLVGLLLYDVFWVFGSPTAVGDNVSIRNRMKVVYQHHGSGLSSP